MGVFHFLGHIKGEGKQRLIQWFWINSLRTKIQIGKHCYVSKDFLYGKDIRIGNYANIGTKVKVGDSVRIGNNTALSKIDIGDFSYIEAGVKITGHGDGKIIIGKESYIGINNILDWSNNINIGNFVHIAGASTCLWTHSSAQQALEGITLRDKNPKWRPSAPIIVEDNVYIGGNCTIYPGVHIGHHSVITPNSTVNKNIQPYTMVGGTPAKKIKDIQL